jgi:hypothetical protein
VRSKSGKLQTSVARRVCIVSTSLVPQCSCDVSNLEMSVPSCCKRLQCIRAAAHDTSTRLQSDAPLGAPAASSEGHSAAEPYLQDLYSEGDVCDLTGKRRQAHVRYVCREDSESPKIGTITEVATCEYVITVGLAQLCENSRFSNKAPSANIECIMEQPEDADVDADAGGQCGA